MKAIRRRFTRVGRMLAMAVHSMTIQRETKAATNTSMDRNTLVGRRKTVGESGVAILKCNSRSNSNMCIRPIMMKALITTGTRKAVEEADPQEAATTTAAYLLVKKSLA